ncbi:hypothetical protein [Ulvibacterium sp.]|uniref:hypothetical protein n=1 Tax=Ulvibacterium sp. TaxID=2665914 RepID=UPI003BAD3ABA
MSLRHSKYNSAEGLKITYYLGAGASYNALPIWSEQGSSMIVVAKRVLDRINSSNLQRNNRLKALYQNETLINFAKKLEKYGELAIEYGSIDIYARRLHLLDDKPQLNELKYCLSVYFDLWEKYLHLGQNINKTSFFSQIDKRYYSLLSVLLEKNESRPKLNDLVSFITWNYDLQVEMAYSSFLQNKKNKLEDINSGLSFLPQLDSDKTLDVIHLNGFRGVFKHEKKIYPIVEDDSADNIEEYLLQLLENYSQFKRPNPDYTECIKYAWEADSNSIEMAKKVMSETDILIIIGYSFPSFNRRLDSILINAFEETGYHDIIYQDPFANIDIIESLFSNSADVKLEKLNTKQFYIPHEFLFPSPGAEISFG